MNQNFKIGIWVLRIMTLLRTLPLMCEFCFFLESMKLHSKLSDSLTFVSEIGHISKIKFFIHPKSFLCLMTDASQKLFLHTWVCTSKYI